MDNFSSSCSLLLKEEFVTLLLACPIFLSAHFGIDEEGLKPQKVIRFHCCTSWDKFEFENWPNVSFFSFKSKITQEMARWRLSSYFSILTNIPDFLRMKGFTIPISLRKVLLKLQMIHF